MFYEELNKNQDKLDFAIKRKHQNIVIFYIVTNSSQSCSAFGNEFHYQFLNNILDV